MVIDFQHHYIPVQLAKKRGLYSETGRTMLEEGGLPATTMHRRLYDLDLQLDDMAQAGIDLSVLSCLAGLRRLRNAVSSTTISLPFKKNIRTALSVWLRRRSSKGKRRSTSCAGQLAISDC